MTSTNLVNVEIGFPDSEHITVDFDWKVKEETYNNLKLRKYCETILFLCYVIRQLRNMRDELFFRSLNGRILEIEGKEAKFVESDLIIFPTHCLNQHTEWIKIKGENSVKQMETSFTVSEDINTNNKKFVGKLSFEFISQEKLIPFFLLVTKKFGFETLILGKGMPQYVLDSILAFYAFLLRRYKSGCGFYEDLPLILFECINKFDHNEITRQNQEAVAVNILTPYFKKW